MTVRRRFPRIALRPRLELEGVMFRGKANTGLATAVRCRTVEYVYTVALYRVYCTRARLRERRRAAAKPIKRMMRDDLR